MNPKNSANAILLSFALFLLLVVALSVKFTEGSLEGLAVGNSFSQTASGGSDFLQVSNAVLPGNNSLINYSNGQYTNVGNSSLFSFTLGILYNCNQTYSYGGTPCGSVQLVKYGAGQSLLSLGAVDGTDQLMSGVATTVLETGEYVQLVFGAAVGNSLEVLPGSSYSIIRISQSS
jgi:hypothetical protein